MSAFPPAAAPSPPGGLALARLTAEALGRAPLPEAVDCRAEPRPHFPLKRLQAGPLLTAAPAERQWGPGDRGSVEVRQTLTVGLAAYCPADDPVAFEAADALALAVGDALAALVEDPEFGFDCDFPAQPLTHDAEALARRQTFLTWFDLVVRTDRPLPGGGR